MIDLSAERARLDKEIAQADADIKRVDAKLGNEKFVANAPDEIVEEEKEKREAAHARKEKILEALKSAEERLGNEKVRCSTTSPSRCLRHRRRRSGYYDAIMKALEHRQGRPP